MQIYLVGGAVRDELLSMPVTEHDWVVVGATPEALLAEGFMPVGKDFPVFLHPDTKQEYALARTERKIAKGYKGFQFYADSDVSLEQDLQRRDLTINAIAKTDDGHLIDPYGGQKDLQAKLFRHVSAAFAEDPVRILRVARFASKLPQFSVHPSTNQLMKEMVMAGEVDALVAERVWKEMQRALAEQQPPRFFQVLQGCGALKKLFPDLDLQQKGFIALQTHYQQTEQPKIRLALLFHDLAVASIKKICQRYKIPREYTELALLVATWLPNFLNSGKSSAKELLHILRSADAFRRPQRFDEFLQACLLCANNQADAQAAKVRLVKACKAIQDIDISSLQQRNLQGQDFADALYQLQIAAIRDS